MNKNNVIISTILFLIVGLFPIKAAGIQYGTYINKNYNYEIIVPKSWQKVETSIADKHSMFAKVNANTGINVRAFRSSDEDIEKIIHAETWDLKKIDPKLNKIIETEKIKIQKNITGKLLLFDYRAKQNNLLQRTLIAINGGIIYIIECKSPISTFYKYEDIFTTALASFKYIDGSVIQKAPAIKQESKKEEQLEEEPLKEESLEEDEQL
jgi:hypothetical protein